MRGRGGSGEWGGVSGVPGLGMSVRGNPRTTSLLKLWEEEAGGRDRQRRNFFKSLKVRHKIVIDEELKRKPPPVSSLVHTYDSTCRMERYQVNNKVEETRKLATKQMTATQHILY